MLYITCDKSFHRLVKATPTKRGIVLFHFQSGSIYTIEVDGGAIEKVSTSCCNAIRVFQQSDTNVLIDCSSPASEKEVDIVQVTLEVQPEFDRDNFVLRGISQNNAIDVVTEYCGTK